MTNFDGHSRIRVSFPGLRGSVGQKMSIPGFCRIAGRFGPLITTRAMGTCIAHIRRKKTQLSEWGMWSPLCQGRKVFRAGLHIGLYAADLQRAYSQLMVICVSKSLYNNVK